MAHLTIPIFQLQKPVGKGKPNLPDDVRLVEALIEAVTRAWQPDSIQRGAEAVKSAVPRKLSLSGLYNANLQTWIDIMQESARRGGKIAKCDGVIDPMPCDPDNPNDLRTIHCKKAYVLWTLQLSALNSIGPEEFMSLRTRLGLKYEATINGDTLRF